MSLELRKVLYRWLHRQRKTKFNSKFLFCTVNGLKMTYWNIYWDVQEILTMLGIDRSEIDGFSMRGGGNTLAISSKKAAT